VGKRAKICFKIETIKNKNQSKIKNGGRQNIKT